MQEVTLSPLFLNLCVDSVAALREHRSQIYPNPLTAALLAQQYGADGISVHLSSGRLHTQDEDVLLMKSALEVPLTMLITPTNDMLDFCEKLQPESVVFCPDNVDSTGSDEALDVAGSFEVLQNAVNRLESVGVTTSVFIAPELEQVGAAKEAGFTAVDLSTAAYTTTGDAESLAALEQAAQTGLEAGLQVNASGGLSYQNLDTVASLPELTEVTIGHAIISRAVFVGLAQAIQDAKQILREARR